MWILLLPAAAIVAGWLYGAHKVAAKAPPLAHDKEPKIDLSAAAASAAVQIAAQKGTGLLPSTTVDGHGTGVLEPDLIAAAAATEAAKAAAAQAAASQAATIVAERKAPATVADQAATAAEVIRLQTIDALNTPEGDRTPEQLALLLAIAGTGPLGTV
jgi:hypothetical protein